MQIPVASKAAGHALNGLHGVAAEYLTAGNFSEARRIVEDGRKWARTVTDTAATERFLVYIAQRAADMHLQSGDLPQARASLDAVRSLTVYAADQRETERLRGLIEGRSKGKL